VRGEDLRDPALHGLAGGRDGGGDRVLPESYGHHFGLGAIGSLVLVRLVAAEAAATAFGASILEFGVGNTSGGVKGGSRVFQI